MEEGAKNENPVYLVKDLEKVLEKGKDEYFKLMSTQKPKKQKEKKEKESKS